MYSWKDRLRDWANQQGAWTHILVAVGITIIIVAIILAATMPSKGVVDTNAVDIGGLKTAMGAIVDGLATKASQAEFDSLEQNVNDDLDDQAGDVGELYTRMGNAEVKLNEAMTGIPPEAYLTGTFGNYMVHVESSESGVFTANIHLVYSAPIYVGNITTHNEALSAFYSGIIWTEATPSYVAVAAFNGTAWGIDAMWWNVGIFELVADTEKTLNITCAGLNSTWEPSFAYVEVWPILK